MEVRSSGCRCRKVASTSENDADGNSIACSEIGEVEAVHDAKRLIGGWAPSLIVT